MKVINKHKLCECSPAARTDGVPCPHALARIEAIACSKDRCDSDDPELGGCPWFVNDPSYDYCFAKMMKDIQHNPLGTKTEDKDICHLLCLKRKQLKEIEESAFAKLRAAAEAGDPEIVEFIRLLKEKVQILNAKESEVSGDIMDIIQDIGDDSLFGDSFEAEDYVPAKRGRKKKIEGLGMPIHRSGKKLDMFGLYSETKLRKMRDEKDKPK
jgi:hypothetical protein